MYELSFDFTDDAGNPFFFVPNYNVQLEMNVFYTKPLAQDNGNTYYPNSRSFVAPH
jgi:hypothetical protein